jgi:predicted Zn-dependent protease
MNPMRIVLLSLLALSTAAGADEKQDAARAALVGGRYGEVERLAKGARPRDEAELLVARAEVATGRYAEAEKRLAEIVKRTPAQLAARLEQGRLFHLEGRNSDEQAVWNRFFDDYEQGRIDKSNAAQLTMVAVAARELGSYEDASSTFGDATRADPNYEPARLEWGETFLEKYAAGEAEEDARSALQLAPNDPEAHVLMARVKIEQSYDAAAANRELDLALKLNPRHAGALALRATLLLDIEEYAEVEKIAKSILAVNPKDERAHTLLATVRFLHDDTAGFAAEKKAVLAVNPRAVDFFHGIAEFLVKQHRYVEANDLENEALKIDPKDPTVLAAIGQNYLRLGDEKNGLAALQQAFDRDRFNVRTFNLLNLFDDVIPKNYGFIEAPPFRVRVPTEQKEVLAQVVAPMVSAEYKELVARYKFTPQGPLQIELYAEPQHYAVRTTGLPGLEALGVTFGKIVTGRSPAEGRFNWGMMLWHEISHVFAIQMSKGRVPRWFTEGLSEYETERRDHGWRRHTQGTLYAALRDGKLLSVAALNTGFVRARSVDNIVIAYHEAAEAVSFLVRRWGFDKAAEALRLYGAGKQTPEVLKAVTGLDVAGFDKAFQTDLGDRLKNYAGNFAIPLSDYADLDGIAEEAKAKPKDARVQALHGMALLHVAHDPRSAANEVKKALALDGKCKEALFAEAELAIEAKRDPDAALILDELVKLGGDGFDARMKRGEIYLRQETPASLGLAELDFAAAKKFDPESAEPYETLAKGYLKANRTDDALVEMEAAARLDVHDASLLRLLLEKQTAKARWDKVRDDAALMMWVEPFSAETHLAAARASLGLHDPASAVRALELALLCKPKAPGTVHGLLAKALLDKGDRARAKKMAETALVEDPANADAKSVIAALSPVKK